MRRSSMHRRRRLAAWTAGVTLPAALLAGCEPEPTDGVFPDRDVAQADANGGSDGTGGGDTVTAGGFSGQWAMVAEWSTCVKVVDELETRAWRLLLVDIEHANNRMSEKRTLCDLRLTPILGLPTVVPQPVIDAHPVMQVESVVLGGQGVGAAYAGGSEVQRFGIEFPTDPLGEPMPTKLDIDDPRLVDVEEDGQPGATFHVGPSCSIHIAQREVSTLSGTLVAEGRFEGGGIHTTEQVVFSSTKAICGQTFSTRPNDVQNRFAMVRAGAFDDDGDGKVTCAELRAHGDEVLVALPADDARCQATK